MSKKVRTYVIFIGTVLVLCLIGLINSFIITGGINFDNLSVNVQQEKVIAKNILLTETKEGKKYWEIFADGGEYLKKRNRLLLLKLVGNVYKNEEVNLSFIADKGYYENKSKQVTLMNNAIIATNNDTAIRADKIIWNGSTNKVVATGNVEVVKSDEITTKSDKTVFTTDFKEFKIYGNTMTSVYSKGNK